MGVARRLIAALRKPPWGQRIAFSQEGEDLVLESFLYRQTTGFYVDIGAHHPTRYSNTHLFYRKGWRGINIDAAPEAMAAFEKTRPEDINLTVAVGNPAESRELALFSEHAVSTLSPEFAERVSQEMGWEVVERRTVTPEPLAAILDKHLPPGQAIAFLNVDVEGLDLEVLQSNDWQRYRPRFVLAEHHGASLDACTFAEALQGPLVPQMKAWEYELVAKTARTLFFRDMRQTP